MSIDKKGFRYRLSNVFSWGALGGVALGILFVPTDGTNGVLGAGSFWLFIGVINYLMVGSLRLLPWRDIEDQE